MNADGANGQSHIKKMATALVPQQALFGSLDTDAAAGYAYRLLAESTPGPSQRTPHWRRARAM
jgi:hypothetical protein